MSGCQAAPACRIVSIHIVCGITHSRSGSRIVNGSIGRVKLIDRNALEVLHRCGQLRVNIKASLTIPSPHLRPVSHAALMIQAV